MMRSLYSGVAGLKVHQTRMDVIGNNIANVNTVGFKSQSVNFSELFYQTTQAASGPNAETSTGGQNAKQIGLGVSVSTISTNVTAEGGSQSTGNAFDIKINGSSFFIIQSGGANYYSKAGNFTTDGYGNLVTPTGAYVMGYTAERNANGDMQLVTDELNPITIYSEEYMTTDPAQTTKATMSGNINKEDDKFEQTGYVTSSLTLYDSLGAQYTVMFKYEKDADPTKQNAYNMSVLGVFNGTEKLPMTLEIDNATNGAVAMEFDGTTGYVKSPDPSEFTFRMVEGTIDPVTGDVTSTGNTLDSFPDVISVDFSEMKCMASSTDIVCTKGDKDHLGTGKAVGNMIQVGIQTDGKIVASYDNGDTNVIGQILVASFLNAAGLEKQGDNLFASTLNSGDPQIKDVSADGDTMSSGVLEMSNVDLADEFTSMIVTQRGYQANSRIITTSDTMIEELLTLKR